VPADVAYPTDSGLLARAVRRIVVTGRRIRGAGGASRTRLRDRSRAAGRRAHAIAAKPRLRGSAGREEAQAIVRRITGELAELAERTAAGAERLLTNARRALRRAQAKAADLAAGGDRNAAAGRRRGRLQRAVDDLAELLTATRTIAARTRQRLAGITPDGASRRVSLHDPDARPIAKGRLGRPVEFGYKAQAGTAPASTPSKEPGSGPDRRSSPTTLSRSPLWPADRTKTGKRFRATGLPRSVTSPTRDFFRSK
jgi:transposase, IS5 family